MRSRSATAAVSATQCAAKRGSTGTCYHAWQQQCDQGNSSCLKRGSVSGCASSGRTRRDCVLGRHGWLRPARAGAGFPCITMVPTWAGWECPASQASIGWKPTRRPTFPPAQAT